MKLRGFPPDGKPALSYVGAPKGSLVGHWTLPITRIVSVPGARGPKGEKGDTGPQGPQGIKGEQGPQGIQGPQGDQGVQGEQGIQGEAGLNLDIQGTVATYADLPTDPADGDAYVVAADGLLYFFDGESFPEDGAGVPFVGPMGPQGIQGPQGLQGSQGIQGPKGDTGDQGPQGIQGEQGPQGVQGVKGDTGSQGPAGDQNVLFVTSLPGTGVAGKLYVVTQ
ncbi:hypothetical protein JDBV06_00310 [Mycobacterium phage miche]|nr:hypothetical protein JDBV06_00310 [Mycobacterium phage miche]